MARKANQALIGAFVLGAVLLAVAGVVVLGGGKFFRQTRTGVAYFDGSLAGLEIGAPVTFNGVKIGSVTDVRVVIDPHDASIRTPVFYEIDAGRLHDADGGTITLGNDDNAKLELLIERGLRARLELQSLLTGRVAVALNFYPNTPVRLTGLSKEYLEMPTIPSNLETITRSLENLPIETLVAETIRTMRSVDALVSAPEVKSALGKLDRTLDHVEALARTGSSRIDPLMTELSETAAATRTTMAEAQAALARLTPEATAAIADYRALAQDARSAVVNADAQVVHLAASIEAAVSAGEGTVGSRIDSLMTELSETAAATRTTMAEAQAALARLTPEATAAIADYRALAQDARSAVVSADAQIVHLAASIEAAVSAAEATLDDARNVLGEDSPLRDEFSGTLQEITKAARSLRTLADDLDRHPEAVVVGKRPERRR